MPNNLPIRPAADSELGCSLARLEALRAESQAAQQELARLRDELYAAGGRLRKRSLQQNATQLELDEMQAAAEDLQKRFDHLVVASKPLLDRFHEANDRFQSDYAIWLTQRAADQARQLGGWR